MKDLILKHSLANASQHGGRADANSVIGRVLGEKPELKSDMKSLVTQIRKTVEEINSWTPERQSQELAKTGFVQEQKEERKGLPPLPNAQEGKVVLRLAPFPSGALHIGNAKTYMLNAIYSETYKGKLIFVIDDTIGSEEKVIVPEAYDLIPEGFRWLGVKWAEPIVYKSDRLDIYYKYSKELIAKGFAYVCECSAEELRENRAKGVECKHRTRTVEENMKLFDEMLSGKFGEGKAILRLKTFMQHPNPAFRDRVLCRISERSHPKVGTKYRVWPMLEMSWAIDDYLLGVTHVIRGNDLMIESDMCRFIWDVFGWKHPTLIHTGLVHIEGVKISKSKAQKEILSGEYSGWDDPRTWSLQSLRRRGILPEAVRAFITGMGLSPVDASVPVEILYAENRKMIDPKANRYFAVFNPKEISVENAPKIQIAEAPLHPDFPEKGKRKIPVDTDCIYMEQGDFEKFEDKEIRLMDLFNVKVGEKAEFTSSEMRMESPKVQWVSSKNVKVRLVMPDGEERNGLAEPQMMDADVGDMVQLVRVGFCRVDSKAGGGMVLYFAHK